MSTGGEQRAAGRAWRVARARELRERGLLLREIAAEIGVATQTVFAWLDDPDGCKLRERKQRYGGVCVDCGAATSGSDGRARAPARCGGCAQRRAGERARWTRASIIEAIGEFERRYGHAPAAADWNPDQARRLGHHARAARFYADGCWPWSPKVLSVFGRWNDAIRAAGFAPTPPGAMTEGARTGCENTGSRTPHDQRILARRCHSTPAPRNQRGDRRSQCWTGALGWLAEIDRGG